MRFHLGCYIYDTELVAKVLLERRVMIRDVEKGQYVWFVIPQELSWYPVVLGARVERAIPEGGIEVRWKVPHAVFERSELYSTRRAAYVAAEVVLRNKIERMKSRTIEMEHNLEMIKQRNKERCICKVCDVNELSLHHPCIEKG